MRTAPVVPDDAPGHRRPPPVVAERRLIRSADARTT
jgi:hypothetical protein